MPHLSLEELARLVDEAPAEHEEIHLRLCAECRAELVALREQTVELRRLPDRRAPARLWPALHGRLRAEGLVAGGAARGRAVLRIAAGLALFLAGGVTGVLWTGARAGPLAGGTEPGAAQARTVGDAEAAVRAAEAAYLDALTRYAELSGAGRSTDPVNRLAALEGIVLTTRAALEEAPADPVINGYHLAALSQREAMLRQISSAADDEWF